MQKLFEFWCEIAPPSSSSGGGGGHILSSFPDKYQDTEIISKIPEFAYPCQFAK